MQEPLVRVLPATAHGWLKVAENSVVAIWEKPDGGRVMCRAGVVPEVASYRGPPPGRWPEQAR